MKKNNKGFSLIEVIVALLLFSIVFVSLLQLIETTSKMQQRTKRRENMSSIALSVYETFLLDPRQDQFLINLNFIYDSKVITNFDQVGEYRINFNGEWKPTSDVNYKYYALIEITFGDEVLNVTENPKLIEETCRISFYDSKGTLLLEKDPITTYVLCVKGC